MAERLIKYFQHPSFSEVDLTARNPLLKKGEIVFVLEGGVATRFKVGPGRWNDLSYMDDGALYDNSDSVVNPIGDATGDVSGKTAIEILELMLHPYATPVISNLRNNAGGVFDTTRTIEIGLSLSGNITLTYALSNASNLSGSTPIQVSSAGLFSNDGNKAHMGSLIMNLAGTIAPTVPTTYTIQVRPVHLNGNGSYVNTTIRFYPKLIWGVTSSETINSGVINTLINKNTSISNNYRRDYTFTGAGYSVLLIPTMLAPTGLVFTDVTDPNAPAGYSMENLGTISYNNGVGTYSYTILRSTYYLTEPQSILRVA